MKKIITTLLVITLFSILSFNSITNAEETDYGASGATTKDNFTLAEMLTYAIQDEYLARAEYVKIMATFDVQRPFSNIKMSEENHISMLKPLFEKYGVILPADSSADHVIIPDTLLNAYKAGVQAEINNIAMYEMFLKQDLPDDVRNVFLQLEAASENHLRAFQNGVASLEGTSGSSGTGSKGSGGGCMAMR